MVSNRLFDHEPQNKEPNQRAYQSCQKWSPLAKDAVKGVALDAGSGRWSTADEVAKAVRVTLDLTAHAER
jgi:hypothetical protein